MDGIDNTSQVARALGEKRLQPLSRDKVDMESAIEAYSWEMKLGQGLLKPISVVEVTLRNAIDQAIQQWWESMGLSGCWTDSPLPKEASVLSPLVHVSDWRRRAEQNLRNSNRAITHDDLIAHTSFGTWKNIIGNPASIAHVPPIDEKRLSSWKAARKRDVQCAEAWKEVIYAAFPNIPATKGGRQKLSPRGYIGVRVSHVAGLRNRVCHWDNLTGVSIVARYHDMLEIVEAVNEPLAIWMNQQCSMEITNLVDSRPDWL